MGKRGSCGLVIAIWIAASVAPGGQLSRVPAELGWVGLYNRQLIEWLENATRLDELCQAIVGKPDERDRCRAEKLETRPLVVTLRTAPDAAAASGGSLLLLATPGKGLRFFYVTTAGGSPRPFEPDLYLQDWRHGPYFHQTYLERRGTWFLLPQDPFPAGSWFNARDLVDEPKILPVGGLVHGPNGGLVIIAIEPDQIRARPQQPADMWCEAGAPPPLKPWTELRISRRDLYSRTGHLLVSPGYMKRC